MCPCLPLGENSKANQLLEFSPKGNSYTQKQFFSTKIAPACIWLYRFGTEGRAWIERRRLSGGSVESSLERSPEAPCKASQSKRVQLGWRKITLNYTDKRRTQSNRHKRRFLATVLSGSRSGSDPGSGAINWRATAGRDEAIGAATNPR